ncbi:hypothetical protein AO072_11305 [Pseudomonas syringae ICMP 13102]|nr:hypothetical protein AO072_11305 [Pseudomonas syringae ICMP 13102]
MGKNIIKQIALEKAIDWAYEEEERLFLEDVRQDLVEVGVDGWGRKIMLNSYPAISLAKIYVGLRSSDGLIRELVNSLRQHSLDVEIYKARRSVDEFGLSFSLIDQGAYDFIGES